MRKFILAVVFCVLVVNIQAAVVPKQNDDIRGYWWILHNDGCYYLYRIEVGEEYGRTLASFYPMNHLNYHGTFVRCTYAETIESMC